MIAYTKLLDDKCVHKYTKHVYVKFLANLELFMIEIEKHVPLYGNSRRCST